MMDKIGMKGYKRLLIALIVVSIAAFSTKVWAVDIVVGTTAEAIDIDEILTEEEIATMQEQDLYVVGYIDDFMPLSYINSDGDVSGAGMDVWNAVAEVLDIEFQLVEATTNNIADGSVDVYLTRFAPDGIVMENQSTPYYTLAYVYIHGAIYEGDESLPVGALSYFELTEEDIDDWLDGSDVIVFGTFSEMNDAFSNGEIQSMVLTSARFNNVKDNITEEYSVEILKGTYECCLSYGNNFSDEKIEIINKVIAKLDDTTVNYSILEHSTYSDTSLVGFIQNNPVIFRQIIFASIIVIILLALTLVLIAERGRKQVLERKLKTDSLTGLLTSSFFEEELKRLIEINQGTQYTIFSFDIDNFKYINEIYGHETGNKVLQSLGKHLLECEPVAILEARISGDQFVALIETSWIKDGFFENLEAKFKTGFTGEKHGLGKEFRFSFSLGYYHIVDTSMNISNMINCARMGKELGKKTVGYTVYEFTPEMGIERANNNHVVATMNSAVAHKEFVVYYQPKVDLKSNKIVGAEALVRWARDGKLIPPYQFIPIFEKNGFIETIDKYVLDEVCRFIKDNEESKVPIISVNLSVVTVKTVDLVAHISNVVESYGLQPKQLDFEITESALIDEFESAIYKIQELRNCGFTIAMDDFGVGISSLSQLKKIPLDILKIDRGFIIDALTDDRGAIIVEHIVLMAKALNLRTIAEGIETKAQEEFFRELGCEEGQGYFYSRPIPEQEFLALLKRDRKEN